MPYEAPNQPPRQPWQDKLSETAARVEEELRNLASYINDEVVPDVRRYSSEALRNAAIEFNKLAQKMDDQKSASTPPPPPPGTPKP